jgi:Uma2 family endonuclease
MSMPQPRPIFTVDEYLALERASDERHEYIDGQIYAMAGESGAHGDISVNLVIALGNQLKGTRCRARTKDTKVRSGPVPKLGRNTSGMFCYPEVVVVCGEPEYHDAQTDVVLNPTAIIEVLSPSTEALDRGEKFARINSGIRPYATICSCPRPSVRSSAMVGWPTAVGPTSDVPAWKPLSACHRSSAF